MSVSLRVRYKRRSLEWDTKLTYPQLIRELSNSIEELSNAIEELSNSIEELSNAIEELSN